MFAIHTKQAPYITYAIGARILAEMVPDALYWDTADPYHYVRLEQDASSVLHSYLIVGGEDHKSGQAQDGAERFARLEHWARERFPSIEEIDFQWAGQVMQSMDGVAFIGRNPLDRDNVFIATGDSGVGMTHGTIAGMILKDLILGHSNPWTSLYDPARVPVRALPSFMRENLNVASQYAQWLTPGEVDSVDEIAPGHGAILREGLNKVAIFRDQDGKLCKLSATCPHLKCVVAWNDAEQTWDCPCHGSRFDPRGHVLNGPANVNLAPWPHYGK
ncbi:MAG: FAD-dependent oxidoreductase [Planctomycetes bacterium]|nr:FAD-dependent oxidoreductase [Planctomycetota bacterium]